MWIRLHSTLISKHIFLSDVSSNSFMQCLYDSYGKRKPLITDWIRWGGLLGVLKNGFIFDHAASLWARVTALSHFDLRALPSARCRLIYFFCQTMWRLWGWSGSLLTLRWQWFGLTLPRWRGVGDQEKVRNRKKTKQKALTSEVKRVLHLLPVRLSIGSFQKAIHGWIWITFCTETDRIHWYLWLLVIPGLFNISISI